MKILLIGLGGAAGSILRYLTSRWVTGRIVWPTAPLWGTLAVNVAGCLVIGVLFGLSERCGWLTPEWRLLLVTGFCGGYTTFSAFALENATLLQSGNYLTAALYIAASVLLCIGATFAGIALAR